MGKRVPGVGVLRKALKLIVRGWVQEDYQRDVVVGKRATPCYCAAGAIAKAATGSASADLKYDGAPAGAMAAATAFASRLKGGSIEGRITRWNDKPGRTQAQVIARFEKTIARLEKAA